LGEKARGIQDKKYWEKYLGQFANKIDHPIKVNIK
jgi:hypothetical protein